MNIKEIREAFLAYTSSEGCGCCSSPEEHRTDLARMEKLLGIKHKKPAKTMVLKKGRGFTVVYEKGVRVK
jgi:hypothetical protein